MLLTTGASLVYAVWLMITHRQRYALNDGDGSDAHPRHRRQMSA